MGMGGMTIHSRTGLKTPYLGEEYLQHVRSCIKQTTAAGGQVLIYDEDRWPSGYAGGFATRMSVSGRGVWCSVSTLLSFTTARCGQNRMRGIFATPPLNRHGIGCGAMGFG